MKSDLEYIGEYLKCHRFCLAEGEPAKITTAEKLSSTVPPFSPATLYLTSVSELFASKVSGLPQNLLCIEDSPIQGAPERLTSNMLFVSHEVTLSEVTDAVQSRILAQKKSSSMAEELLNALYQGRGIKAVADIGYRYLKKPVVILDTSYKAIAIAAGSFSGQTQLEQNIISGYLDRNTIAAARRDKVSQLLASHDGALFLDRSYGIAEGKGIIGAAIRIRGLVVAYISVLCLSSSCSPEDLFLIDQLTRMAALELQKNEAFITRHGIEYEAILFDLLEHQVAKNVAMERFSTLGRKLEKNLFVVAAQRSVYSDESSQALTGTQIYLRKWIPNSISVNYKQGVVLLVSRKQAELSLDENEDLNIFLEQNQICIGVSNRFEDPTEMQKYYQQAIKALELGQRIQNGQYIYAYSDFSLYHMIDLCSTQTDVLNLCHPGMRYLMEHGSNSDRELIQTLYLYLLNMKDAGKTAEQLHIHKNTLFYRVKRALELLKLDVNTGDAILQVLISYKIYSYHDRMK